MKFRNWLFVSIVTIVSLIKYFYYEQGFAWLVFIALCWTYFLMMDEIKKIQERLDEMENNK